MMGEGQLDRLRAHAPVRPVAIPDTQGEIQGALSNLEELLAVAGSDADYPDDTPLVSDAARNAVARLWAAVHAAEEGSPAQPVAPDGRYELVPVAWAQVEAADLTQLGLTVHDIGRAWAAKIDDPVVDVLEDVAGRRSRKPEDLIAEAARLHGLLSLPWDDTVSTLHAALPPGAGRVVLDEAAHAAYQRLVDRVLAIWHVGDDLAPFLYRGR